MKERIARVRHKGISIGLMVLSLIISFALWAYVMVVNDPDKVTEIPNIPVSFIGEENLLKSKDLIMTSDRNKSVTLSFRGRISDLFRLTRDNVKVVVDLSSLTKSGEFQMNYDVSFPLGLQNGQVAVTGAMRTVPVTIDQLDTKPVGFKVSGSIDPSEGYMLGQMKQEPMMLTVTGPAKVLDTISYAEIELPNMDPINTTFSESLSFRLCDEKGNKVSMEYISVDVNTVGVTIPVVKYKQVRVGLEFLNGGGLVAEENIRCEYSPQMITVAGDAEVLESLNYIVLETIDLSTLLEPCTKEIPIRLQNGIELFSEETSVSVRINFNNVTTKTVEVYPFASGFEQVPGYKLSILTKQLSVTLRGTPEALQSIHSTMLRAEIALSTVVLNPEATAATMLPVNVTIPDQVSNAGVLGTYSAYVQLVPAEPETEEDGT